mmetsp:Transcript_92236/g.260604  ORF Transcript_92236/g.260604 Transcript_92236/m.260604 type:complete len:283 (+) Transcript_92236:2201-3049(+)
MWMAEALLDKVNALIHPGLVLDVLDHLGDRHHRCTHVLPVGARRLQRFPDHLEKPRHKGVLFQLLRQSVKVFFSDRHDGVVVFLVVVVFQARLRPLFHIFLDLEHPQQVEANNFVQLRLRFSLGEVLGQAGNEHRQRHHGALPDFRLNERVGPSKSDLRQSGPEFLHATVFEEVGLLGRRRRQRLQGIFQQILLNLVREALQDEDQRWHYLSQLLRLFQVEDLYQLQDELRTRRADLGGRVSERGHQHRNGLVALREEALPDSLRQLLHHVQGRHARLDFGA